MTKFIFLVVLLGALADSIQHALIKSRDDAFGVSLVVALFGGVFAIVLLGFTGLPDPAAYPWLAISVALGCVYWVALGAAYQTSTLALVFPMSRGTGIVLTTIGAATFLNETLSVAECMMVAAVLAGLAMVAINGAGLAFSMRALRPSFVLAMVIAAFILVDAAGVRASGSAAGYCALLYIGNAVGIGAYALTRHRRRVVALGGTAILTAAVAGGLSLLAYVLILYGMTHAPVALVAALAETSIIFVGLIGILWLHEPARLGHMAGLAMVAFGVFVLRLAQ